VGLAIGPFDVRFVRFACTFFGGRVGIPIGPSIEAWDGFKKVGKRVCGLEWAVGAVVAVVVASVVVAVVGVLDVGGLDRPANDPAALVGSDVVKEGDRVGLSSDDWDVGIDRSTTPEYSFSFVVVGLSADPPINSLRAALNTAMANTMTIQKPRPPNTQNRFEKNRKTPLVGAESGAFISGA
jgi:hypothetical protein